MQTQTPNMVMLKGGENMYKVLSIAMAQRCVSQRDIAKALGIHYNTVNLKLAGKSDFDMTEAKIIHQTWFDDLDFAGLFTIEQPQLA